MTICFISGFSQQADILRKLGESINLDGERLYFSISELDSYASTLKEKIKDKKNIILIGWSLGGTIALEYAAKYDVSALIIVSGTSCYLKTDDNLFGIEPARIEALIRGVQNTKEQSLRRFISSVCSPFDSQVEFDYCYNSSMEVNSNILVDNLEYYKKDFRPCCEKINCPTLILHDIDDRVVPVEQGEILHDLIKGSKKYFTNGFGHLVIQRQPEILAREIEKLFRYEK